eukprot:COSAG06_NODE_29044_length_563_cov_1.030172_1_plen_49_part_10
MVRRGEESGGNGTIPNAPTLSLAEGFPYLDVIHIAIVYDERDLLELRIG